MAALISLFVPGLGHLIIGKPFQAILFFVVVIIGYICLVIPGIILHLICIVDAARAEKRLNTKIISDALKK